MDRSPSSRGNFSDSTVKRVAWSPYGRRHLYLSRQNTCILRRNALYVRPTPYFAIETSISSPCSRTKAGVYCTPSHTAPPKHQFQYYALIYAPANHFFTGGFLTKMLCSIIILPMFATSPVQIICIITARMLSKEYNFINVPYALEWANTSRVRVSVCRVSISN